LAKVNEVAKETGAVIEFASDLDAVKGADVIYTDVGHPWGRRPDPERVKLLTPYQVNMELLKKTGNPKVIFMHCLPSFHDFETKMARNRWKGL
jgi:ornithine carbamoyltransferase